MTNVIITVPYDENIEDAVRGLYDILESRPLDQVGRTGLIFAKNDPVVIGTFQIEEANTDIK